MLKVFLAAAFLPLACVAQTASYPLETISVTGTAFPKDRVVEIAGLRIGMSLNKAAIEEACGKLQATGFFQSVGYHYTPAPKGGYALTLALSDAKTIGAAIDIPGVDEDEVWRWLEAKYPPFDHKVPSSDAAEQMVIRELEEHLGSKLEGHSIVTRNETVGGKMGIVFEPDVLPRVASMSFTGNQKIDSAQLLAAMEKINAEQEYTERRFRNYVDLNLRRLYEEHGMYKARFPSITSAPAGAGMVNVTVAIEEGPQYTLGEVHLIGGDLPEKEMLQAANFKIGQVADWTAIQNGVWAMEKPVKRAGYYQAAAVPERVFDDEHQVLSVNITIRKGPFYRFGNLTITGLSPDLSAKVQQLWKKHPGDPYDYEYPNTFLLDISKDTDIRIFRKFKVVATPKADYVMDVTLEFEPR